jgi:ribonuclease P protein component
MPKQFTLGKKEKLKSRKQIGLLFSQGKSFAIYPFRIYYQVNTHQGDKVPTSYFQFGIGVSSKNFKKAVDRNRVKRLTREAWRLNKTNPVMQDLRESLKLENRVMNVFFIYTGKEIPDFELVKEKVTVVLKKLKSKTGENDPANT